MAGLLCRPGRMGCLPPSSLAVLLPFGIVLGQRPAHGGTAVAVHDHTHTLWQANNLLHSKPWTLRAILSTGSAAVCRKQPTTASTPAPLVVLAGRRKAVKALLLNALLPLLLAAQQRNKAQAAGT